MLIFLMYVAAFTSKMDPRLIVPPSICFLTLTAPHFVPTGMQLHSTYTTSFHLLIAAPARNLINFLMFSFPMKIPRRLSIAGL